MYNRVMEWKYFAAIVTSHIIEYTIKQYGDSPDDEVEKWTPEACLLAIGKYVRRFEGGQRGPIETLRDMLKIAHFACLAYFKLSNKLGVTLDVPKIQIGEFVHGSEREKKDAEQPN